MKTFPKILTGAATAALVTLTAASPAQAQYNDRYYDRDNGIDIGDVITGVAVVGGIAAVASAIGNASRGYDRGYGYDPRYGGYERGYGYNNGYGERAAIQACTYEAQRYARGGRVQITDLDRRSNSKFRVRGIVDSGYGGYGGYDRYNRSNARVSFECDARADGRITDFDTNRGYASRW